MRQAADAIDGASTILVVSHFAPDGDAIGSLLGMAAYLRAAGKAVTAAIDEGVPPDLRFIPGSDSIQPTVNSGEFDLLIAVDSSDVERSGAAGAYGMAHSKTIINLDHHPTNTQYGNINLVVPEAVAAAEIVFDFLAYRAWELSTEAAYALLTGLVTDTQGFRVSATNSRTLDIAQSLMNSGAPLSAIMAQTLNRRPIEEVELWKRVLPSVRLADGLISAVITQEDVSQAGSEETGRRGPGVLSG